MNLTGRNMDRKEINVAILGATGHIAKGLIYNYCKKKDCRLFLFSRSVERVEKFLDTIENKEAKILVNHYEVFDNFQYDVIINCVGMYDLKRIEESGIELFRLTESFDNLVLDHITKYPGTIYINLSSGAVYGDVFNEPANENTIARIDVNHMKIEDFYTLAKLHSEAKHRALSQLNIIDIRIFSYYSRFLDINSKFFLSEIIRCIFEKKDFVTNSKDIVRDYVHPLDLLSLIYLIEEYAQNNKINQALDVYSLKPVTKFEILDFFKIHYGLKVIINEDVNAGRAGLKNEYYSLNKKAEMLGYIPRYTSLQGIEEETRELLKNAGEFL